MELFFMKVLGTFSAYSVLSQSLFSNDDSSNNQQKQGKDLDNQSQNEFKTDSFCYSKQQSKPESNTSTEKKTTEKNSKAFNLNLENNCPDNITEKLKKQFNIAVKLLQNKQYSSAIINFKMIQALAEIHKLHKSELKALEAIARIYDLQNNLDLSLSYYYKAFNCADKSFNTIKKAELANNIASIHTDLKQYQTGLKYYKQALFLAYLNNDDEAIDIILNSICTTMQEINFINKTVA